MLEIVQLNKHFINPGGVQHSVVDIAHFALGEGIQIGLKGGSGSGKTTFLNLIAGILKATSGRIVLNGTDLSVLNESQRDRIRARHLGYIFQTFNLLPGYTALENVVLGMAFGAGVDEEYALRLLERVGLQSKADYRTNQLSVGQQQRVAVARALANRPKLVLADEPTGNLDRRNAAESLALIREVCSENNAALLLVSHDPEILLKFETVEDFEVLNQINGNSNGQGKHIQALTGP